MSVFCGRGLGGLFDRLEKGSGKGASSSAPPPPAVPAPPPVIEDTAAASQNASDALRRRQGKAATILAAQDAGTGSPAVGTKKLLGN
jgi:hypothetical protein